jgi:hypothetical protein
MVLETPPSHFPDLFAVLSEEIVPDALESFKQVDRAAQTDNDAAALEDGLDEPGSFERFYLSSIFWLHRRANASSPVLRAMNVNRPIMSLYAPAAGHLDPAYIIGFMQSEEAGECRGRYRSNFALLEQCYALADRIIGYSQLGVELTKQMLWAGLEAGSMHSHMNHEGHAQLFVRMTTRNFEEAIKARRDKRKPEFKD